MSKIKQYADSLNNVEIERKFLVINDSWKQYVTKSTEIYQIYLSTDPAVRVRTTSDGQSFITIKSSNNGMTRSEFEYNIPQDDAAKMIELFSNNIITKVRHIICDDKTGHFWEIDQFRGYNSGLVIAEIELQSEQDRINLDHSWIGQEVTDDHNYYNNNLYLRPYKTW